VPHARECLALSSSECITCSCKTAALPQACVSDQRGLLRPRKHALTTPTTVSRRRLSGGRPSSRSYRIRMVAGRFRRGTTIPLGRKCVPFPCHICFLDERIAQVAWPPD